MGLHTGFGTVVACLVLGAGVALSGCASRDDGGVATADGGSAQPAQSAQASASASQDASDQRLQLTRCLREQGIDIPDQGAGAPSPGSIDFQSDKFQKAMDACRQYLPANGGMGPGGTMTADQQAQFLELAACMREQGVDFPDPKFDSDGHLQFQGLLGSINPSDPKVREAFQSCSQQVGLQLPGSAGAGGQ